MSRWKGSLVPLCRPRWLRMAAVSPLVCSSSSLSMAAMTSGGVLRASGPVFGIGRVRVWCWPPRSRTCALMVSLVLVAVTSVSSSRAMRLRSRIGVAGSFQMAGRSVTSWAIRSFWASVSWAVCSRRALS